ncbi:Autophagy-related protein [Paramyrothecium foliicola]|nr:Autophagy-related protein [Paramyrothecium foliicola]
MAEPSYTIFVRVPIPRGDFVDPPLVNWDSAKDNALWKILSGAAQTEIDWNQVADRFEVPVDFLLQQVAYLTERHASQVRAQVRKATAAAKGSSAPSPIPGLEAAHQRTTSALSVRRDSLLARNEAPASASSPSTSVRPVISRNASTNTTILREAGVSSPRPGKQAPARLAEPTGRRRLSSLPVTSTTAAPPDAQPSPEPPRSPSPGPAESSSTSSDDDESYPAQSRIIRRPPRFQQQEGAALPQEGDDDDESEPAFQPYRASGSNPGQDLASTLKGDGRGTSRRGQKLSGKDSIHYSQTSDSSAGSAAIVQRPGASRDHRAPGPLSPRRAAELAGRSPSGKSKGYSREGSDGTPSMGSSFSDLDDASVTQSALEEALASHMNRGGTSRYFITDEDEIRSTENPDNYFKFYIDKNMRINIRQRFEFHSVVEGIIHQRLEENGLCKMTVPLGTPTSKPHIPIFVTPNLKLKTRVVVLFGEPNQAVGILAHRVMEGSGGLKEGSMLSVIHTLNKQRSSPGDASPPGVVLANPGATYWWPEEQRALTIIQSNGIPLPSLCHNGRQYVPAVNEIPENKDSSEHIKYIFGTVLKTMMADHAVVDVVAIGASCELVENFFDHKENWAIWGQRLNAMLLLGTVYPTDTLTNTDFKNFLAKRASGFILSPLPPGTPLAPPTGNPNEMIPELGCPVYSSSEQHYTELILIKAHETVLAYLQGVAMSPDFENVPITVVDRPTEELTEEAWATLPEEEKPSLSVADPEEMRKQVKQARRWKKFADTGMAPESSSDEEEDDLV